MALGSFPISYSPAALVDGSERNFPESKYRSKRIRKKLLKRFGGHEFKQVPGCYKTPWGFVLHPALRDEFERQTGITPAPTHANSMPGPRWGYPLDIPIEMDIKVENPFKARWWAFDRISRKPASVIVADI